MASSPITSWQIDGGKVETVSNFIYLGSKINADSDCSYIIKRRLLPGRKAMTNLDGILKSRDSTLPTRKSSNNTHTRAQTHTYAHTQTFLQLTFR